jgi:hypothetical protein
VKRERHDPPRRFLVSRVGHIDVGKRTLPEPVGAPGF